MNTRCLHLSSLAAAAVQFFAANALAAEATVSPRPQPPEAPPLVALGAGIAHAHTPQTISRNAVGVTTELRPVKAVSLGLTGKLFAPFDGDHEIGLDAPRRTQTLGSVMLDMRGFVLGTADRRAELYVLGAVGTIFTRPLSVRDPAVRSFDWASRNSFALGAGGRFELGRHFAAFVETRGTAFFDQLEAPLVHPEQPADPHTWLGEKPLTTMLDLQVGFLVLFPR